MWEPLRLNRSGWLFDPGFHRINQQLSRKRRPWRRWKWTFNCSAIKTERLMGLLWLSMAHPRPTSLPPSPSPYFSCVLYIIFFLFLEPFSTATKIWELSWAPAQIEIHIRQLKQRIPYIFACWLHFSLICVLSLCCAAWRDKKLFFFF